ESFEVRESHECWTQRIENWFPFGFRAYSLLECRRIFEKFGTFNYPGCPTDNVRVPGMRYLAILGCSVAVAAITITLFFVPTLKQRTSALTGTVITADGRPIAGIQVYGSPGKCCPVSRDLTRTNNFGVFRLERPGSVIHISDSVQNR